MAKILLTVPIAHCSARSGSGQRTHHLYRALADAHGVDVLLVPEYRSPLMVELFPAWFEERFPRAGRVLLAPTAGAAAPRARTGMPGRLAGLAGRMARALQSPALPCAVDAASAAFVRELVRREAYDLVAGRYLAPLARCGALELEGVPVVLDVDDRDEHVVASRLASATTPALLKPLLRRHLREIGGLAPALRARCSHLWLASERDRREVAHPSTSVLRNIPFAPEGRDDAAPAVPAEPTDARACLFVGGTQRLNREGVVHFVHHVWPRVRDAVADARFRVVGSGGWERLRPQLERFAGVEVVGAVDDLAAEYARASFAVIPLLEGAGTKIKVLESLQHRRPVVCHRHAVYGFDELAHMDSVLVADSDEDLARACITLFNDRDLARRLAASGAGIVARTYSFASFARTVTTDVAAVLARPGVTKRSTSVPMSPAGAMF